MKYLLFDARYNTDPERATLFEVCDTREEAEERKSEYGNDVVIVEEEVTD